MPITTIPQKTLDLVNQLLEDADPLGSFTMGMVCCSVWKTDPSREIPRGVLVAALQCTSLAEAEEAMATVEDFLRSGMTH